MRRKTALKTFALGATALAAPTLGMASTIDSTVLTWNTSVNVETDVALAEGFASVVYQGDPDTAETNGRIYYDNEEASAPGLVAINDGYASGQGEFDGCLRASAADVCATGFRTGNRFKMQLTDTGAIDLVFDVGYDTDPNGFLPDGTTPQPNPEGSLYQVFGRAVNLTTQMLDGFIVELGYGVGGDFEASGANDGLSFAQNLELGPDDLPVFTQYPFGLFGDETTTNRHDIDGFFDDDRAGFDVAFDGEDRIVSTGFYGGDLGYEARFDHWLSQEMAPSGLLWDDDGDEATDALVMAWFNEDIGLWEALRSIAEVDGALVPVSDLETPATFASADDARSHFQWLAATLLPGSDILSAMEVEEHIEDLANLNLNYGILLTDAFAGSRFTLRFTSLAAPSPVPLPASALLLLGGLGGLMAMRRRRGATA